MHAIHGRDMQHVAAGVGADNLAQRHCCARARVVCARACLCVRACGFVCARAHVCVCVCVCVCSMGACVCVCAYACMYVFCGGCSDSGPGRCAGVGIIIDWGGVATSFLGVWRPEDLESAVCINQVTFEFLARAADLLANVSLGLGVGFIGHQKGGGH